MKHANWYPDIPLEAFMEKEKEIKILWMEIIQKFSESEIYEIHNCIVDYQRLVPTGHVLDSIIMVLQMNLM